MAPGRRIQGFGAFLSAGPCRTESCCREFLRRREPGLRTRQRAEGGEPGSWPCNVSKAALGVPLCPRQVSPHTPSSSADSALYSTQVRRGLPSAAHRSHSLSLEVMEMAEEAAALLERLAAGLAAAPSGGSPALSSSDGSDRPAPCEESPCCWSLRGGKGEEKRS